MSRKSCTLMSYHWARFSCPGSILALTGIVLLLLLVGAIFLLSSCNSPSTDLIVFETADPRQSEVASKAAAADLQFGEIPDAFGNASDWPVRREQVARLILEYLGEMPPEAPALEPQVLSEERFDTYIRRKVSYQVQAGERVVAYLLLPIDAPLPRPAVLALHQTVEQGKLEPIGIQGHPDMAYGLELVKHGFVVLAPDTITAGDRLEPGQLYYDTAKFDLAHPRWSAMGKMLWDHRRGLDYLQTLAEVDPNRIGVIGHSLGGYNALFLAAFDERIKVTVTSCAYTRIQTDPGKERWSRSAGFVHFPKLRPYVVPEATLEIPWDFHHVLSLVSPRAIFQSVALDDSGFPNSITVAQVHMQVLPLYQYQNSAGKLTSFFYDGGHGFPGFARKTAYDFLLSNL